MSNCVWRDCHWFDLRVHWPGSAPTCIGILLRDGVEGSKLHIKIQPNWWRAKATPLDELILSGLHENLVEIAQDIGADGLFDWLENNASHLLRVGPQSEIRTDDVEATLQTLFQEHCSRHSWLESAKRLRGKLGSPSNVIRRVQWLQPVALTAAFAFVVPEVATRLAHQRSDSFSQTAPQQHFHKKSSGLSGGRVTNVDEDAIVLNASPEQNSNSSSPQNSLMQESSMSKNHQSFAALYAKAAGHPLMDVPVDRADKFNLEDSLDLNLPSIWSDGYRRGIKNTEENSTPAKSSDSSKTSEESRVQRNNADDSKRELAASLLDDTGSGNLRSPSLISPITGGSGANISFPGGTPIPPPSDESLLSPPSNESTLPSPEHLILPPSGNNPDPSELGPISNSPEPKTTLEFLVGLMVLASPLLRKKMRTRSPLQE